MPIRELRWTSDSEETPIATQHAHHAQQASAAARSPATEPRSYAQALLLHLNGRGQRKGSSNSGSGSSGAATPAAAAAGGRVARGGVRGGGGFGEKGLPASELKDSWEEEGEEGAEHVRGTSGGWEGDEWMVRGVHHDVGGDDWDKEGESGPRAQGEQGEKDEEEAHEQGEEGLKGARGHEGSGGDGAEGDSMPVIIEEEDAQEIFGV